MTHYHLIEAYLLGGYPAVASYTAPRWQVVLRNSLPPSCSLFYTGVSTPVHEHQIRRKQSDPPHRATEQAAEGQRALWSASPAPTALPPSCFAIQRPCPSPSECSQRPWSSHLLSMVWSNIQLVSIGLTSTGICRVVNWPSLPRRAIERIGTACICNRNRYGPHLCRRVCKWWLIGEIAKCKQTE